MSRPPYDQSPRRGRISTTSILFFLAVGLCAICCGYFVHKRLMTPRGTGRKAILAKDLLSATLRIETYSVEMVTRLRSSAEFDLSDVDPDAEPVKTDTNGDAADMIFNISIVGETGKRLRMEMIPVAPEWAPGVGFRFVFDGVWQWIENRMPNGTSVLKLKIDRASPDVKSQPFNTFYFIKGSGLVWGEDFPGTVVALLNMYDLEQLPASDGRVKLGELVFVGQVRRDRFVEHARRITRRATSVESIMAAMKDESAGLFRFSKENLRLVGFQIGPTQDAPSTLVEISYKSVNGNLPREAFKYAPPKGVNAKDITDAVLRAISATQEHER